MCEKTAKRIEVIANLSVIAAALVGCILWTRSLLPAISGRNPAIASISSAGSTIGRKITLPGVDWADHKKTVVLTLSTTCRFCSDSAPFFQRLSREIRANRDARLIAVFPQDAGQSKAYLESLSVPVSEVVQAPLASLGVRGTPAVSLVDDRGSILKTILGRVPAEREAEVLAWLK